VEITQARLVNVILVESGLDRFYYSLEGVEIGHFYGASKVAAEKETEVVPKSAVTKNPPVEQVRRDKDKANEEASKVENRYPNIVHGKKKDDVV
jgi:hypothetical protein